MTEDEAKTKWCPFARVVSDTAAADSPANRYPGDEDANAGTTNACIGSACMAWRRNTRTYARIGGGYGQTVSTHGYCGLAGKPA